MWKNIPRVAGWDPLVEVKAYRWDREVLVLASLRTFPLRLVHRLAHLLRCRRYRLRRWPVVDIEIARDWERVLCLLMMMKNWIEVLASMGHSHCCLLLEERWDLNEWGKLECLHPHHHSQSSPCMSQLGQQNRVCERCWIPEAVLMVQLLQDLRCEADIAGTRDMRASLLQRSEYAARKGACVGFAQHESTN